MGSLAGFTEQLKPGEMALPVSQLPLPEQFLDVDGSVPPELQNVKSERI